jgi:hypothetical protein
VCARSLRAYSPGTDCARFSTPYAAETACITMYAIGCGRGKRGGGRLTRLSYDGRGLRGRAQLPRLLAQQPRYLTLEHPLCARHEVPRLCSGRGRPFAIPDLKRMARVGQCRPA